MSVIEQGLNRIAGNFFINQSLGGAVIASDFNRHTDAHGFGFRRRNSSAQRDSACGGSLRIVTDSN